MHSLLFWRLTAAIAVVFCVWAGLKPTPWPQYFPYFDKWFHGSAYFLLTLNLVLAFPHVGKWCALLLMPSSGLAAEWLQQYFLPGRTFDWLDVAADIAGAFTALVLIWSAIVVRCCIRKYTSGIDNLS